MNIIFVSNNMAKARTLTLVQAALLLVAVVAIAVVLTLAIILPQGDGKHQGVKHLLPNPLNFTLHNPQEHLDALALQLGELQARVMRLDALSDRLSRLAGVKDKDAAQQPVPGRGGPEINAQGMTEQQLQQKINELTQEIEQRSDHLSMLEALFLQQRMKKNTLPSSSPVNASYNSSSYGWRIDPFTGRSAFHEGLDFVAEVGTPIYAAADGIVTTAEQTPDYGKIVKIDHGSGLETRYAHASLLLVKVGDRVSKGQVIAQVGTTGRSTGPHLHFEVRLNGAALDPRKYLRKVN